MFERGGQRLDDEERSRVAEELRATRQLAAERLAATVAALENIRLDSLRLQMGSGGVESVTASLDAARRIGDEIAESLAPQAVVERLLLDGVAERGGVDEDPRRPTGGVAAART